MPTLSYTKKKRPGKGADKPAFRPSFQGPREAQPSPWEQGGRTAEASKKKSIFTPKIRRQDVLFFTRQLYTLHKAGIPITDGLRTIAGHEKNASFREIILEMKQDVEEGLTLTDAMRKHPAVFSHFYTGVVEGGEQNGVLSPLLDQLTHYMENEENVKRSIKSALRYPTFVLVTLALAFVVIMTFIFPRFKPLFSKFGDNLPYQTKVLLGISSVFQHDWMFLIGGIAAGTALFLYARRYKSFRQFLDRLKFGIPLLGKLYQYASISRFANMLSTFFSGGMVNYLNILQLTEKAFDNVVLKMEIRRLTSEIVNGKSLGESMERSRIFPPLFAHLTHVGEKTGEIQSMMKVLYEYYEQDLRYKTQKMIGVIEPMILLVTSGFILFVALGIFMPYWRLMEVVK